MSREEIDGAGVDAERAIEDAIHDWVRVRGYGIATAYVVIAASSPDVDDQVKILTTSPDGQPRYVSIGLMETVRTIFAAHLHRDVYDDDE